MERPCGSISQSPAKGLQFANGFFSLPGLSSCCHEKDRKEKVYSKGEMCAGTQNFICPKKTLLALRCHWTGSLLYKVRMFMLLEPPVSTLDPYLQSPQRYPEHFHQGESRCPLSWAEGRLCRPSNRASECNTFRLPTDGNGGHFLMGEAAEFLMLGTEKSSPILQSSSQSSDTQFQKVVCISIGINMQLHSNFILFISHQCYTWKYTSLLLCRWWNQRNGATMKKAEAST